jgi:hypothetical protein
VTEELVEALWVGSHPAELPDRRILQSGKDTALVGRTEAETSDNWRYPIHGDDPGPETARAIVEQLADATADDAQATLDREHAAGSPRKTVTEAAERRLQALADEAHAAAVVAAAPTDDS